MAGRLRAEAVARPFQGENVLELGSGLGYVGLHLACMGCRVVLTDLPAAQPVIARSIEANSSTISKAHGTAEFRSLDWGQPISLGPSHVFDFIVSSDPVFDELTQRLFVLCLARLLKARHAPFAKLAHKHRPGVCCAAGISGMEHLHAHGDCGFRQRLEEAGLKVEDAAVPASTAPDHLLHHPFVAVWQVSLKAVQ
eukprot:TRINITY_DN53134_c0_g1_i1.p1 TRINITY_DN53134_c0_g1~~TRINITY_DN53134_c0_g1_i1.p1  ORF type:complete len:196 (-),score=38.89 TRINITY_DN53134_c0_g1_i1:169-756(-)